MTSAHGKEDNRIFHKECVSLAQAGYDVYLVQCGESYEKDGVHIIGAGEIPQKRIKRMTIGSRNVFNIAKSLKCDLYHIHDPELLPYGVKLHELGKKVVFDSHELYREQLKNKTKVGPAIARVYSIYEKWALKKIEGVIFPCPILGENPFKGLYNDFAYVNNVPRLTELYDHYNELDEKIHNSLCYIGTLSRTRGITNIIKAAAITNSTLYLAGECHNKEYLNEIMEMPEFESVHYLGVLNRKEIEELLSQVEIGIATLLNVGQYYKLHNLPTKVYEYMAMGIPSIISDTPYNQAINDEYHFGKTVNPNNIDDIAIAINQIRNNRDSYREMSRNGRDAIKSTFNWEKESKNLLDLYSRILHS